MWVRFWWFPYILYIDAIRKHQNEDYKNRDNLIDTGLKISTELNMANMVDRFNELRIVYQIKNKSPDEAKVLLQNKIGECNNRELYIGNLEKPPNLR